jgi:hypothetical protein
MSEPEQKLFLVTVKLMLAKSRSIIYYRPIEHSRSIQFDRQSEDVRQICKKELQSGLYRY